MNREYFLWLSLAAYAIHIYEEAMLGWLGWARSQFKLTQLEMSDFYLTNAVVIVIGAATAQIGWNYAAIGLFLPALQWINGLFFHVFPVIFTRRFSPGVITAVLLFLPIGTLCFWGAVKDGAADSLTIVFSLMIASALMAIPFVFYQIKSRFLKHDFKK
jgi:hypothetical protein